MERVSALMANFDATNPHCLRRPVTPHTDDVNMMLPPPCLIMYGIASFASI